MLFTCGAGQPLFQPGCFIESIPTQVLVVFAIGTRRRFFLSRPRPLLVVMASAAVAAAIALPLLPVGHWFGFVTPPLEFFAYLVIATAAYLALVEFLKGFFYRFTAAR